MQILIPENQSLRPFQIEGVSMMLKFLNSPIKGTYCADEQGLGKTIQSIAAVESLKLTLPTLIVCPAVMRGTWRRELLDWTLGGKIQVAFGRKDFPHPLQIKELKYLVISYELAVNALSVLKEINWGALILDEAHYVKNHKAKRTKAVLKELWPKSKYRICLSGTPITRNVVDFYSIFSKFLPTIYPKFSDFGARYAYPRVTPFAITYEGLRKDTAPELSATMRKYFYFRRKKEEVLPDLPAKIFKRVTLSDEFLFKGEQKVATELDAEIAAMLRRLENNEPMPAVSTSVQGHRRLQGEMKVPAVVAYVKDLLEQDIPVVLFGYHSNVLDMLIKDLSQFKPVVIRGGTSPKQAQFAVESFQAGKTNLFIGQINAAGIGITLTASSNVIIAEPDWSPAVIAQAVDRCHRIGQKDSVTVHYFVVPDSIDEEIISALMRKAREHAEIVEN